MTRFLVAMAVGITLPSGVNAADSEITRPYDFRVILHIAPHRLLTQTFRRRLRDELQDGIQSALGDWPRSMSSTPTPAKQRMARPGHPRHALGSRTGEASLRRRLVCRRPIRGAASAARWLDRPCKPGGPRSAGPLIGRLSAGSLHASSSKTSARWGRSSVSTSQPVGQPLLCGAAARGGAGWLGSCPPDRFSPWSALRGPRLAAGRWTPRIWLPLPIPRTGSVSAEWFTGTRTSWPTGRQSLTAL